MSTLQPENFYLQCTDKAHCFQFVPIFSKKTQNKTKQKRQVFWEEQIFKDFHLDVMSWHTHKFYFLRQEGALTAIIHMKQGLL